MGRFELRKELGRGGSGVVYEAYDRESQAMVALKTLTSLDGENLFRLKQEFRALSNLEHENFVRLGELASAAGHLFFTMERLQGSDFLQYVRANDSPATAGFDEPRLRKALAQLVDALGALHAAGKLHRDVKPPNVLVTTEGRLVLLDFGLTSSFGLEAAPSRTEEEDFIASNQRICGTPAYMAPEQLDGTALSPATDWYAVGVMLYAALAGELPFHGNILQIAQAKRTLGRTALAGKAVPEDLRALCFALLQPEAASRPGIRDIRARLGLSPSADRGEEVFVGRKAELEQLRRSFERARTATQAVVVCGEPGIGKSELVERFLSGLRNEAIVLRGRCYEQERVPFGGVDSLIDALSEYLLGLSDKQLARLLDGGALCVARVFPVLYRLPILAEQRVEGPAVNTAALRDHATAELAQIFAMLGSRQTTVLFLDDLQWVDRDSLALIRQAFLRKDTRCLFVATMRSNAEMSPELATFVASLERIEVGSLSDEEAFDAFSALGTLGAEVSEGVVREASGHPLFLGELLRSVRSGTWVHDTRMRLQDVLRKRICERGEVERTFLEMTALAGAPTPYTVLAQAAGLDAGDCASRLAGLRIAQLVRISRVDESRCVEPYHDRVREALLERLAAEDSKQVDRLHLQLGRALVAATPDAALGSRLFSIVHHLNAGRDHIDAPGEKRRVAELNLLASQRAIAMTAFELAQGYAEAGLQCLLARGHEAEVWSREPLLCRELCLARMVGQYRMGDRDRALRTFEAAKRYVRDPAERTDLYVTLIELESTSSFAKAIEAANEILTELGEPLPRRATKLDVLAQYARTRWSQRSVDELRSSPQLRDPHTKSVLRVLVAAAPPSYMLGDANLFAWNVLRQARVAMQRGLCEMAPSGLIGYGIVLSVAFGRHRDGAAFGRLAIELADRDKYARSIASAHCGNAMILQPWVVGFTRSLELAEKAVGLAHAYGDTEYEAFSLTAAVLLSVATGRDLEHVERCAERGRAFGSLCNLPVTVETMEALRRHALALRGQTPSLVDVSLPGSSHAHFVDSLGELHGRVWIDLALAELSYFAGDLPRAEAHFREFDRRSASIRGMPLTADSCLLSALIAARGHDAASFTGRAERLVRVAWATRRLEVWARSCPESLEPHAAIAYAELARIRGHTSKAAAAYERAMALARKYDAPKREAIAGELAWRHARAGRRAAEAERYRRAAIDAYRRWGASAKAGLLEAGG
jgi:hypothetical protein